MSHAEKSWRRFLELEREELVRRREGALARALGFPLTGEDPEDLARLAREDQLRAQEGLVDLKDGERVWYKRLQDLVPQDRSARIEAEMARLAWLRERLESRPEYLRPHDERAKLDKRAAGQLSRLIGQAKPGESREDLEHMAAEDQRMAQQGMVRLKRGARIWYTHIDDLTPEDRVARLEADRVTLAWLVGRKAAQEAAAMWLEASLEGGRDSPDAGTSENTPSTHSGK
jgi:hypothetical protein